MNKKLSIYLSIVLIIVMGLTLSGCKAETPVKVAIMSKLEAGSLVGISEVDAAKYFLEKKGMDSIEFIPFDDGWDPSRIPDVYKEVRAQGIDIIITSHTSTCALELKKLTDQEPEDVLVLVTGSTTDALSDIKDNNLRFVQDVIQEQNSIADRILEESFERLVIVRDMDNDKYAVPALEYFEKRYDRPFDVLDISVSNLDLNGIGQYLEAEDFDAVYTLIGGNHTISGAISQVAWKTNPQVRVFFTPWNNAPVILDTAGPAIERCTMASHYPPKAESPVTENYFNGFYDQFQYKPTYNSLHVYKAIDVLSQAIAAGNRTPVAIQEWILTQAEFETDLGPISFNEYGDTSLGLYFIDDVAREYE